MGQDPCVATTAARTDLCTTSGSVNQQFHCLLPFASTMENSLNPSYTQSQQPNITADYRPISIVPILSRVVERVVVRTYMYPEFCKPPLAEELCDQYAFRPTGSITAAVIALLHHTTELLKTNDFVVIISTDYSAAFDTLRHATLAQILNTFDIPDNIYNWLLNYFCDRGHATVFAGETSSIARINSSVIQGSVVGPASFITSSSGLHPKYNTNINIKYVDDSYLLIGSNHLHTAVDEFHNITSWAANNNLRLNRSKTKEMIVAKKGTTRHIPTVFPGAIRVEALSILGVTISSDLKMDQHINRVLSSASSSL